MQLSISTATAACSVALLDGKTILSEQHQVVGRGHAEHLIPMIQALPGNGRADMIWVDCGPGSFTGTRVGLAAARALALAWGVPVLGFSSMSLIAATATTDETLAVAVLAGHGELFVQDFTVGPLAAISAVQALAPHAAAQFTRAPLVLGSGAETLVHARGFGAARDMLPHAADVRRLPDTLRQLPPRAIYVRAPDAKAA
jgi:tRNA threonylcarbamoyl adenosine modification protein YeaZ